MEKEDHTETGNFAKYFLYLSYRRKKLICMAENRIFYVCELLREMDIRKILILIACKALDEGVDVPDAGIGIILSGTCVERQKMQAAWAYSAKEREEGNCRFVLSVYRGKYGRKELLSSLRGILSGGELGV